MTGLEDLFFKKYQACAGFYEHQRSATYLKLRDRTLDTEPMGEKGVIYDTESNIGFVRPRGSAEIGNRGVGGAVEPEQRGDGTLGIGDRSPELVTNVVSAAHRWKLLVTSANVGLDPMKHGCSVDERNEDGRFMGTAQLARS